MTASEDQDEALVITYWQTTVWALIQRLSPHTVPDALLAVWQPRHVVPKDRQLYLPAYGVEFQGLRPYLEVLLRHFRRGLNLELRPGRPDRDVPPYLLWLFGSPWLEFDRDFISKPVARYRYRNARDTVVLIRLIACAGIAVRYLQSLPSDDTESSWARSRFAALVAHTADVLFRGVEGHGFDQQLRGLYDFGRRHVRSAGRGALPAISPRDFLEIVGLTMEARSEDQQDQESGVEQREAPISFEERIFRERVLPITLFEWLTDDDDAYGVADLSRWHDLLPQIYAKWRQGLANYKPQLQRERVLPLLAMRFLRRDTHIESGEISWWLSSGGNKRWIDILPEYMLLSPDLPARVWEQPTWPEPNWEFDPEQRRDLFAKRLVRALQRYAAYDRDPDSVSAQVGARWRAELDECLNNIQHRGQIDRFVRLLMLELLDQVSSAQDDLGVRRLIVQVLFEYGTLHDLERLCAIVFAQGEAGTLQAVDSTRQELRTELLRMLFRSTDLSRRYQRHDVNARDPIAARTGGARRRVIEAQLIRVAFLTGLPGAHQADTALRRGLREIRYHALRPRTLGNISAIDAELAYTWDRQRGGLTTVIRTPPNQPPPLIWMVRGAVFDPNELRATIFADEFETEGLTNLFAEQDRDPAASLRKSDGEPVDVLALVMYRKDIPEQGVAQLKMNCGLRLEFSGEWPRPILQGIEPGSYVMLPIVKDGGQWTVSYHQPIKLLTRRLINRDVVEVYLRETYNRNTGRLVLDPSPLPLEGDDANGELPSFSPENRSFWDPDLSRRFRELPMEDLRGLANRRVLARTDAQFGFVPVNGTLADLLLTLDAAQQPVFVLTLVSPLVLSTGEQVWCFARQPGENYIIYEHQFDPAALERLLAEGEGGKRSHGLLVSLRAEIVDGIVRLGLVEGQLQSNRFAALFPQLQTPFDRRNLEWRSLFDTDEQLIARRFGDQWVYELPRGYAIGYPRRVAVHFDEQPRRSNRVEFTMAAWSEEHQRECRVDATLVNRKRLWMPERERDLFLKRWQEIGRKSIVRLGRASRALTPQSVSVQCFTRDSMIVSVDLESLTLDARPMRTLTAYDLAPLIEDRLVEILNGGWEFAGIPLVADAVAIPAEAWANGVCEGLLVEVPELDGDEEGGGSGYCEVLWQTGGQPVARSILVVNAADLRLQVGSWICGTQVGREIRFELKALRGLRGRALWSKEEQRGLIDKLTYLGDIPMVGSVAMDAPGQLVQLRNRPANARHLAVSEGDFFSGGLPPDRRYRNLAPTDRVWTFNQVRYRPAMLTFEDNGETYQLLGSCRADTGNHNLVIRDVRVVADRVVVDGESYFALRRQFNLESVHEGRTTQVAAAADWREKYESYMNSPTREPQRASFDGRTFQLIRFSVPSPGKGAVPTSQVSLLPGDGPYIVDNVYLRDALVWLVEDEKSGTVYGSLRRVPPSSPERFRAELDAVYGELVRLKEQLYYAGVEPEWNEDGTVRRWYHRFEYGYGKTLYAPEEQLRFNGEPFNHASLLLTYGDVVHSLTFQRADGVEEDDGAEEDEQVIITISDADIKLSMARSLYVQRRIYRMLHVAHLRVENDRLLIHTIDGVDQDRPRDATIPYNVRRAELAPESQRRLQTRLAAGWAEHPQTGDRIVLVRLDKRAFEETGGQQMLFHHVRFSLKPDEVDVQAKPDEADVQDEPEEPWEQPESEEARPHVEFGELLITRAGDIRPVRNDMLLRLEPLLGLHPADLGQDMAELAVLRRQFSVREDLLRRVYELERGEGHQSELRNRQLLTRILRRDDNRPGASMVLDIPPRGSRALVSAIAAAGGTLIAVVARAEEGRIRFELLPGVFVELKTDAIQGDLSGLTSGSYVQIRQAEAGGDRPFHIVRAAFGDRRYVTAEPRPVVVLPKNTLLNENARTARNVRQVGFWLSKRDFTVGSLPNIDVTPGVYNDFGREWIPPHPDRFIELLSTEHPKFARLGLDKGGQLRLGPPGREIFAGGLSISRHNLEVRLRALSAEARRFNQAPLEWRLLSYADRPASEIRNRAMDTRWSYHDTHTGTWTSERVVITELRRSASCVDGPVFFEQTPGGLRLRYSPRSLLKFGYGASELERTMAALRRRSIFCPVIGPSEADGLWVELGPGRVVEIPAQMIELDPRFGGVVTPPFSARRDRSLTDLHWRAFAPGDMVELGLQLEGTLQISRFSLKDWRPGPRAALGPQRCLLPVRNFDPKEGSLELGVGDYELTLPVSSFDGETQVVALTPENDLRGAEGIALERGDVVLIGLSEQRRPVILGLPEYSFFADKDMGNWRVDPLAEIMTRLDGARGVIRFNEIGLAKVIALNGGALPMTVEGVSGSTVFLSRRHQLTAGNLPINRRTVGHVLGQVRDDQVLLRCGGGLFVAPLGSLVAGLPSQFYPSAADVLREHKVPIWLRKGAEGNLEFGFTTSRIEERTAKHVEALALVSTARPPRVGARMGLICRVPESQQLYWLPETQLAWAELSPGQLGERFLGEGKTSKLLMVSLNPQRPYLSLLDHQQPDKEFRELVVGKELLVRIIGPYEGYSVAPLDSYRSYLAESSTTGILLECAVFDEGVELKPNDQLTAEVIRRVEDTPRRIVVTPLNGTKPYRLDLPDWMLDRAGEADQPRQELMDYRRWMRAYSFPWPPPADLVLSNISLEELQEWLCYAYLDDDRSRASQERKAEIAEEWFRRSADSPALFAAYPLIAALLLYQASRNQAGLGKRQIAWREQAGAIVLLTGRRALRSLHVDVLANRWLSKSESVNSDKAWRRLRYMGRHLQNPATREGILALRRFYRSVELREQEQLLPVAHAIAAATGELSELNQLSKSAEWVMSLIGIIRKLPQGAGLRTLLNDRIARELDELVGAINIGGVDVTLLDPLPPLIAKLSQANTAQGSAEPE